MMLYEAGSNIPTGSPVIVSDSDGKAYATSRAPIDDSCAGLFLGWAISNLREGFQLRWDGRTVQEDDA